MRAFVFMCFKREGSASVIDVVLKSSLFLYLSFAFCVHIVVGNLQTKRQESEVCASYRQRGEVHEVSESFSHSVQSILIHPSLLLVSLHQLSQWTIRGLSLSCRPLLSNWLTLAFPVCFL